MRKQAKKRAPKYTERQMIQFLWDQVNALKAENRELRKRLSELEESAITCSWDDRPIGAPHGW